MAVITDLRMEKQDPDPALFPGIPSGIKLHSGFAKEHAKYDRSSFFFFLARIKKCSMYLRTANDVLAAVKKTLASDNVTSNVTVVGHSLGASQCK